MEQWRHRHDFRRLIHKAKHMQETVPQERIESPTLELSETEAKIAIEAIDVYIRNGGLQVSGQATSLAAKISQYIQAKAQTNGN